MELNQIRCPNCDNLIYFCFDEWGHTPFHLHCKECDINIGARSLEQAVNLLKKYHKPHTLIEFYNKELMLLIEAGKIIIDLEKDKYGI